jgi:hypothetical protein
VFKTRKQNSYYKDIGAVDIWFYKNSLSSFETGERLLCSLGIKKIFYFRNSSFIRKEAIRRYPHDEKR